ncbi:MAG: hypothetical protein HC853_04670 [Anaerolineae bacterium]|nr:hypothetical protein [Anaerolineae bacterium]
MTNKSMGKLVIATGIGFAILAFAVAIAQYALHGSVMVGLKGLLPASMLIISGTRLMYGTDAASPISRRAAILVPILGISVVLLIFVGLFALLL